MPLNGLSPTTKVNTIYRSMSLYYSMVCHQQQMNTIIQFNGTVLLDSFAPASKRTPQHRSMTLSYCMVCHQQQNKHNNTDLCHCTTVWFVSNSKANTPIQIYATVRFVTNKVNTAIQIYATVLLYGLSPTTKQTAIQIYATVLLYGLSPTTK